MIFNQLTNQEYNICIENISIIESGNTAMVSPSSWQKFPLLVTEAISTMTKH